MPWWHFDHIAVVLFQIVVILKKNIIFIEILEVFYSENFSRKSFFVCYGDITSSWGDIKTFISSLELILRNSLQRNKTVIISGDMNIDFNHLDSAYSTNCFSLLNFYMFLPAITKPIRFPSGIRITDHLL